MTDKVDVFNKAGATMTRAAGYRRGAAQFQAFDLAKAFQRRNITFDGIDVFPGQEK